MVPATGLLADVESGDQLPQVGLPRDARPRGPLDLCAQLGEGGVEVRTSRDGIGRRDVSGGALPSSGEPLDGAGALAAALYEARVRTGLVGAVKYDLDEVSPGPSSASGGSGHGAGDGPGVISRRGVLAAPLVGPPGVDAIGVPLDQETVHPGRERGELGQQADSVGRGGEN